MATTESTSTPTALISSRNTPIKKETAASAAPLKKPAVAAKRAAKVAPTSTAQQAPSVPKARPTAKAASPGTVRADKGASAKKASPKGVNGAAAAQASVLPVPETKTSKEKKQKMVRDSVTIPKAEYQALETMKQRAALLQTMVKKTELIRAGIKHLSSLPDAAFLAAIAAVPNLKTGRPSKD